MNNMKKKCIVCNSNVEGDVIGLNKKLIGSDIKKFFCLECLSNYLDVTPEELLDKVQEFKDQGCTLF